MFFITYVIGQQEKTKENGEKKKKLLSVSASIMLAISRASLATYISKLGLEICLK